MNNNQLNDAYIKVYSGLREEVQETRQREIKVVKGGGDRATIPADERERRQRELKKIKDELLTLARRVEALAAAELKT